MNSHVKPDKKTLKPIHLFEAEMLPQTDIDVLSAAVPRYVIFHAHLTDAKAQEIIEFLQAEREKGIKGTITLPIWGRMI